MGIEIDNRVDIVRLQEQMKAVLDTQEELIDTQKQILTELNTFTSAIKAGKWIFGLILLTLGAIGHKGIVWATDLLSR